MSDSEDPIDLIDEGGDDLFGDEDDDQVTSPKDRVLDDDDLASDRDGDADGYNRYRDDGYQTQAETANKVVMGVQTFRHRIPKPQDGSLKVLRVPKFINLMPEVYDPATFQPSEFDLANAKAERPKHVARVRRDPQTNELTSNTNIYRWSDGSVTISVGGEQYEIGQKRLAPPTTGPYNEIHDAHYYAAAAELSSNVLMVVGHVTEQYNIKPNKDVGDDALSILAEKMAQASKPAREGDFIVKTTIDPELQSKQAEQAEKERLKAQRRRENAAARMDGGLGRSGRGGLSVGDLEGSRRASGAGRKRGAPGARPRRHGPEYDSDDEGIRNDSYDVNDDFVVASDEEEEFESGGDDEEEEEMLDEEEERPRRTKRQKTEEAEEDEDAEGSEVEPTAESSSRARRRNVIDDDDEE
ncbi:hypothetical protein S40285_00622 [Stachybotrys chlorohalonatus IBT 40285]|uniref:Leo1-like protein n=1 Tax=Stachybotrys chlorohalonatus (strain IBT 40285) TaxID=1283841 RepID=A0A084R2I5_STAC4|nr:hypothetical protein S40285_00622 [Stachybotrys chlorohalonata IBT 40285]